MVGPQPQSPDVRGEILQVPIPIERERVTIESVVEVISHLRTCRANKAYLLDGSPSFRDWAMKKFGERLGGWIDDVLL